MLEKKINRRSVIKSAGALSGILLAPNLPMWAYADTSPATVAPTNYLTMSSALVAVPKDVLVRPIPQDNRSLADMFYTVAKTAAPQATAECLSRYDELVTAGKTDQEIADTLTNNSGYSVGAASRLTQLMWLFGIWYGNQETTVYPGAKPYISANYQLDFVVSSRAYKNAWIWRAAQAHPMGVSEFAYGEWNKEPPSLSDFGFSTGTG